MTNELTEGKPPEILFQDIRDRHDELQQSAVDIIKGWIEIGEMLIEVKELVPNGWGARCKKELPFTKRTADRYVSLAKHSELVLPNGTPCPKLGQNPSMNKALKLISGSDTSNKPKRLHPLITQINKEAGSSFESTDDLMTFVKGNATDGNPVPTPPPDNSVDMKQIGELADHTVDELREIYKYHKKKFGKVPDLKSIKGVIEFALFAKTRA